MSEELEQQGMDPVEEAEEKGLPGRSLYEWLQTILGCVLTAIIVFNCFACLSRVDGHSMDPTLADGELMLVWSLGYQPKHGDIVVLHKTTATNDLGETAIVKRVIALEGQTVDIDYGAGVVYVDGEALEEDYILEEMWLPSSERMRGTHFEVPEGEVFVLGDNRNGSSDSRHTGLGTIHTDYIMGRAVAAIWPVGRFGLL